MLKTILTSPEFWALLLSGIGVLLTYLFKSKGAAAQVEVSKREAQVERAVFYAFHALQDWNNIDPAKWAADASGALQMIDQYLVNAGWGQLSPQEQVASKIALQGLAGQALKVSTLGPAVAAAAPPAAGPK